MNKNFDLCKRAATAGGLAIRRRPRVLHATVKDDRYVGKHAILTDVDFKSQQAILSVLTRGDSRAHFITEEHVMEPPFRKGLITSDSLNLLKEKGAYVIDELDGTSSYYAGHYEWAVSVGFVDHNLKHTAGAVFAPEIDGETLFYAHDGGSFVMSGGKTARARVKRTSRLEDSYVLVGVDCFLSRYPAHNALLTKLGDSARTVNSNGSCALALGLVASGNADALVQPLQSPWDWAAGRAVVERAGGTFKFYEMRGFDIIPISKPELRHYDPDKRGLGFVAGNKRMAELIMAMLMETNRSFG